jgi:hypothetical protein
MKKWKKAGKKDNLRKLGTTAFRDLKQFKHLDPDPFSEYRQDPDPNKIAWLHPFWNFD